MAMADSPLPPDAAPVTRADLDVLRETLRADIERLRADVAGVESRLLWRLLGGGGLLAVLFRLSAWLPG